ncbi:Cytochrome P [Trema orientale]|uniref:Cytochrome P n=1 Tax=Trema orientale TaxID=63057 RepID=A0A2P5FTT5_TREOI|nr:Cytochrome P [Trema orientale]
MASWLFLILISVCVGFLLKSILTSLVLLRKPPLRPISILPIIISNLLYGCMSFLEIEPILCDLHANYGPIISFRIGYCLIVIIVNCSSANEALIQNGAIFADCLTPHATNKIISSNQRTIIFAGYGPTRCLLRHNLTSEIFQASHIKSYSRSHNLVLNILLNLMVYCFNNNHFRYAMFRLLALMCFGERVEETKIREIETVQRHLLLSLGHVNILNFWPRLTKILLKKQWQQFWQLHGDQEALLVPLINSRREKLKAASDADDYQFAICYVDTLLGLELPEEKRKLDIYNGNRQFVLQISQREHRYIGRRQHCSGSWRI